MAHCTLHQQPLHLHLLPEFNSMKLKKPSLRATVNKQHTMTKKNTMARGRPSCKRLKRSSSPADEMIELKLVVDRENKRVLYVEAGVEFVDFLFSIVSLPLAFFADLGECRPGAGRLYESLTKMEDSFFEASRWRKEELLRPALPSTFGGVKPGWPCKLKAGRAAGRPQAPQERYGGGGMVYMITNDLEVTPMSTASILALMKSFQVSISNVDERMVTVGPEEASPVLSPELTISRSPVQRRQFRATSARRPASSSRRGAAINRNERGTSRNTRGAKLPSSANCARRGTSDARPSAYRGRRSVRSRGRGCMRQVVLAMAKERKVSPSSSSSASSDEDGGAHSDGEMKAASHVKIKRESSQ